MSCSLWPSIVISLALLLSITSSVANIKYQRAIDEATNVANLIYQRFDIYNEYRFQFFLSSMNMPAFAWDILKYKFAMKILNGDLIDPSVDDGSAAIDLENADATMNRSSSETPRVSVEKHSNSSRSNRINAFLMVFGGSSVTAGHDNYFDQSWPMVFNRRMKKVFALLDIKLYAHNIAMGANNCRPYSHCYEAMGGLPGVPIDWLGWEQSFNCGRDAGIFELMARIAHHHGALLFYAASGGFNPNGCPASTEPIPYISERWTPENITYSASVPKFEFTAKNISAYKDKLNDWYNDGNAVERFINPLRGQYSGTGHHGYSVWARSRTLCVNDMKNNSRGCSPLDVIGPCAASGGAHWMTIEASQYNDGNARNTHHPSAGLHLIRGEILAYNYLHILMDALSMVIADTKLQSGAKVMEEYKQRLQKLQGPIPSPADCKTKCHCRGECEYPSTCYTNYEPHFNSLYSIDSIVTNSSGWKKTFKWGVNGDRQRWKFIDNKPSYELPKSAKDGFINLRITVGEGRMLRVCGLLLTGSFKHANFYLVATKEASRQPDFIGLGTLWTKRKYVNDECSQLNDVPPGDYILSITKKEESKDQPLMLSHVITF